MSSVLCKPDAQGLPDQEGPSRWCCTWQVPEGACVLLGDGKWQIQLLDSLGIPRGKEIFPGVWQSLEVHVMLGGLQA